MLVNLANTAPVSAQPSKPLPAIDFWPYQLSGRVYGVLLNARAALAALGEAVHAAPYLKPPVAPVLFIKPRNTLTGDGSTVAVDPDDGEIQINPMLGIVIGQTATRLTPATAMAHIAGYTIVADLVTPHASLHRPSLRFNARDGYCPIGPCIVARQAIGDPNALSISVSVDGSVCSRSSTGDMVRGVATLLVDITEFMTLSAGDIVAIGGPANAPRARAGQHVSIQIAPIGTLTMELAVRGIAS